MTLHSTPLAIRRHSEAPLQVEREQFLHHRRSQGFDLPNLRALSSRLLHVVRLLDLTAMRPVSEADIEAAAERWAADNEHRTRGKAGRLSQKVFKEAARAFLGFHGCLIKPRPLFAEHLRHYLEALHTYGLAASTVRSHEDELRRFLQWAGARRSSLAEVTAPDLQEYIASKALRCTPASLFNTGRRLRRFIAYGEQRSWFRPNLHDAVRVRACRSEVPPEQFPTWAEVRRLLDADLGDTPEGHRARAMLFLCSVYGFRSSEVVRLRLTDIDWTEKTLTVTRSKGGRTQEFPLMPEAGRAIRKYLVTRPECSRRQLFVSIRKPHRPILPTTINNTTTPLMAKFDIKTERRGPHALRHACATELLRTGSSLRQIADFLGHKNMRTVQVYAKCDPASIREVAAFSLKGVL